MTTRINRRGRRAPEASAAPAVVAPWPHSSGARPPSLPPELVPGHVAVIMDGNGRWANARGLPRTKGHEAGEASLLDVVAGGIEIGVKHVSAYAFSTENWKRSPDEVRFLMGFNRDVIHRRRDVLNEWGVRVRWVGRRPRLWRSVIKELEVAQELTKDNDVMTLTMCVNYGGRAEIVDAVRKLVSDGVPANKVDEKAIRSRLYYPDQPDPDLVIRTSGETRISNFLLWQLAYSELVFPDVLWPDFRREHLFDAVREYQQRQRRYGGVT